MSERVKPALTPEEWAHVENDGQVTLIVEGMPSGNPVGRHGAAALCLHGQPFGFWPGLPMTLRIAAMKLRTYTDSPDDWGDLEEAADRIEALLPPAEG